MESNEMALTDEQSLGRLKILIPLAIIGAFIAAVVGLTVRLAAPEAGSGIEGALGLAAAVGGLSAAAFAIATASTPRSRTFGVLPRCPFVYSFGY